MLLTESRERVDVGAIPRSLSDPLEDVRGDRVQSFEKYVPVPYESLVSNMAPMIFHDQVDRSEWIRVQLAVDADRRRFIPGPAVHRVRSDPSLISVGSSANRLLSEDDDEEIDWTAVSPELEALCRNRKSIRRRTEQHKLTYGGMD